MVRTSLLAAAVAVGLMCIASTRADAQLLSPGGLAAAHSSLEGIRNCTSCHQLGQRGIAPDRCLGCHVPLATRIERNEGYHASIESADCADCHQEHLGADFDLLHFDQTAFSHDGTGYALRLSHADVDCRDCHVAGNITNGAVVAFKSEHDALDRTFLGLSTDCSTCHEDENPHGDQFGTRACADCHDEGDWNNPPSFDHAATAYPLDGEHRSVSCADCHGSDLPTAVYRPLAFGSCDDCHEDPHDGAMNDACASCHRTTGWLEVSTANVERRFDHATTQFPLAGAHAMADCQACHQRGRAPSTELIRMSYQPGTQSSTYPRPRFEGCLSCHVEQHPDPAGGVRWSDCASCHSESRFAPSPFSWARHAETVFPLTGAHVVTPCSACHQNPDQGHTTFTLALPDQECVDCHEADDPHAGLYEGRPCAECHVTDAFELAEFDHDLVTQGPDARACASCHADDDPHAEQFEDQDCASCHVTDAFLIPSFDHATTRFPLDGAHADAACASCHIPEAGGFVRYKPLGTECTDCHGEGTREPYSAEAVGRR